MKELGIATNKKLLVLFNMMKDGSLILKPTFQRKLVWNSKHKEAFIETILCGLPFPEIYLSDGEIDLVSQKSKTLVVDGQQRLSTIYQYITNSSEFVIKNISKFESLTDIQKTEFFDYQIVVRDLGRIKEDKIIEIFKRINSVQYALNSMEIQHALYSGEFINTAQFIANNNNMFKTFEIFSESEFTRMKDVEFVLLVISTIEEGGYFAASKEIENNIKSYDYEYPRKDEIINEFENICKLFVALSLHFDSIWLRKSSLFSLLVELIKFKKRNGFYPNEKALKAMLEHVENKILENRNKDITNNEYATYYYYTFQGTTSRNGRLKRGSLIEKHLNELK
jgi:hypothetical protein